MIADGLHLGEDMGREDDTVSLAELADERADLADLDRIEPDRGLIEDHHRGHVDDRLRDTDALLETLGEVADEATPRVVQAAFLLRGRARLRALPARDAV